MKTKKITLLISILLTFTIFAVPALAYDLDLNSDDNFTMWWDITVTNSAGLEIISPDLIPDTNVTLVDGDTLKADFYISGLPQHSGLTWVEGDVTYAKPGMFNELTASDIHLHNKFEVWRAEDLSLTPSGDRQVFLRGGYTVGEVAYGNNVHVLGEIGEFMGIPYKVPGLQLTANSTIDPFANITINVDDFTNGFLHGGQPELPDHIMNLTINAVPVPAAIWLIGSAMLCILGINQRKKN